MSDAEPLQCSERFVMDPKACAAGWDVVFG